MKIIKNKYFKLAVLILLFIIDIIGFIYFHYLLINMEECNMNKDNNEIEILDETAKKDTESVEIKKIKVDIKGYVNKPNVYELEEGSRVVDLVNMAGGLKKGANTRFINLSKVLNDQDTIVIYSEKEIENLNKKETIIVETPCICEEVKNDGCITENEEKVQEEVSPELNNKININIATKEELMSLSGIGEIKANDIIEYRKNKKFNTIEELKNVKGISESIYSKIKENITT